MEFEWDGRKAAQNLVKHGAPFEYAVRAFLDRHRLEREDTRRDYARNGGSPLARLKGGFL